MDVPGRIFITAEDFDIINNNELTTAIIKLLSNIILPCFKWLNGATLKVVIVEHGEDNHIVFTLAILATPDRVEVGGQRMMSSFMENYIKEAENIEEEIVDSFYPTVNPDIMLNADLSPQQFLIQFIHLYMAPEILISNDNGITVITSAAVMKLVFTMEDISAFEPGAIGALATRFRYLCQSTDRGSLKELQQWILELKLEGLTRNIVNAMSKAELCKAIGEYYGFP